MLDMRELNEVANHIHDLEPGRCFIVGEAMEDRMANENDGKPWTGDDLNQLKTLITENTPTGLIAMKLGRTEDAIRDKCKVEGLSLAPTNRSPRD